MAMVNERVVALIEKGWNLDCGKAGLRIAGKVARDTPESPYVAGFYKYKEGRGLYAQAATLDEAIRLAADLADARDGKVMEG
jgi:hypothetical protein